MADIKDFSFFGFTVPGTGITQNEDQSINAIFSICININKLSKNLVTTDKDGNPLGEKGISENYLKFYGDLLALQNYLSQIKDFKFEISDVKDPVIGKGSAHPFEFFRPGKTTYTTDKLVAIKDKLWEEIFLIAKSKTKGFAINGKSKVIDHTVNEITDLLTPEDYAYLANFSHARNEHRKKIVSVAAPNINYRLDKINQYGNYALDKAKREKIAYIKTHGSTHINNLKNLSFTKETATRDTATLLKLYDQTIKSYYEGNLIDIDELVHSFNAIGSDPVLMRLMGLVRDIKITIPNKPETGKDVGFNIRPILASTNIHFPATKVKGIFVAGKYAFLLAPDAASEKFYKNSILNSADAEIIRFDKLAKIQGINHYKERLANGETPKEDDNIDALTRGLCYTHKKWTEIAKPVKDIAMDTVLTDEYLTSGHRVFVQIADHGKISPLYSLTGRSISLNEKGKKPFFYTANHEGCIHTDIAMSYLENGVVKHSVSDTIFEYSGELLTLKSAFSKGQKLDRTGNTVYQHTIHHDSGLHKSEGRYKDKVTFFHFPFTKKQDEGLVNCYYNIPTVYNSNFAPKLRFKKSYGFGLSQHYLGGGGLPIFKENTLQLAVEDLIGLQEGVLSPMKEFNPLESKKPIVLVSRKEVVEDEDAPFSNKDSIEHIVLKSGGVNAVSADNVGVHTLPAKSPIEHVFWNDSLHPEKVSPDFSFLLKRRANCSFSSEADYLKKKKEGKICGENCSNYCGGMYLKDHYPEEQITPEIFADPMVTGYNLKLFWDEECEHPIDIQQPNDTASVNFEKSGIFPSSVLLQLNGSLEKNKVEVFNKQKLNITLKIGSTVYAKLQNKLDDVDKTLLKGWWTDLKITRDVNKDLSRMDANSETDSKLLKEIDEQRNAPKKITLTHASKVPLVTPTIVSLASVQAEQRMSNHIKAIWLNKKEYKKYQFGTNIIANRIDKATGAPLKDSSFTHVDLSGHFERLDAIKKIAFLKNVVPTGGLELWMRKEEYIDDPNEVAIDSSSFAGHRPDEPVIKFESSDNHFVLEHKIEFNVETMAQLKALSHATAIDNVSNPYRAIISQLQLEYDFKTSKFEEREYYLKNISKFKGFFTDKKLKDGTDEKLEDYSLPTLGQVLDTNNPKYRFKVIVLNNKQPTKPEIAFAVTTITEERTNLSEKDTVSTQSGSGVTIYLKRGRLKSGKGERVALFVDASSVYHEVLLKNDFLSKAGKDILSDQYANRSHLIQAGDVIIPTERDNEYDAAFEPELGLYHFLPKFDYEKQLWKFEIQLKIETTNHTQLHNPFVNLSLAHYQPFSVNYNTKTTGLTLDDLRNDCRLSEIENAAWCYLLPERKLSVFFNKPGTLFGLGTVKATLSFDHTSLNQLKTPTRWECRTNFIMTVQGQKNNDQVIWHNIKSQVSPVENQPAEEWRYHHHLLTPAIIANKENLAELHIRFDKWDDPKNQDSEKFQKFRVRFVEVEWFSNEPWKKDFGPNEDEILDNDNMRVRYIELIY